MGKLNICIVVFLLMFSCLNADDQSEKISDNKEYSEDTKVSKLDIAFFDTYGKNRNEIIKGMGAPIRMEETSSDGVYYDTEVILKYPGISFKIWKKHSMESIQEIRINGENINFIDNIRVGKNIEKVLSYFGVPSEKENDYLTYINHLMILSFSFSSSGIIEEIYMVKQI